MHSVLRGRILSLPLPTFASCRIIAGRRFRIRTRSFHSSSRLQFPRNPHDEANTTWTNPINEPSPSSDATEPEVSTEVGSEAAAERHNFSNDKSLYGSATRRALRGRKFKELPPNIRLPPWFLERNITPSSTLPSSTNLPLGRLTSPTSLKLDLGGEQASGVSSDPDHAVSSMGEGNGFEVQEIQILDDMYKAEAKQQHVKYWVNDTIWQEVNATLKTSLRLPMRHPNDFPPTKTHLLLHCPKEGSSYFLENLAKSMASSLGTAILKLDAQDIAELAGDYQNEMGRPDQDHYGTVRNLGYEVYKTTGKEGAKQMDEEMEEEEEEEDDEDDFSDAGPDLHSGRPSALTKVGVLLPSSLKGLWGDKSTSFSQNFALPLKQILSPGSIADPSQDSGYHFPLIDALLEAVDEKTRSTITDSIPDPLSAEKTKSQTRLLILVPDFKAIQAAEHGGSFLRALIESVEGRRKAGQSIVIVGTVSAENSGPSISTASIKRLQSDEEHYPARSIVVTPTENIESPAVFREDLKRRIREINIRHLKDMIRLRSTESGPTIDSLLEQEDFEFDSSMVYASDLERSVWTFDRVHRVATLALGLPEEESPLTVSHLTHALTLLDQSDEAKFSWAKEERKITDDISSEAQSTTDEQTQHNRISRLRKTCTPHEKKLLSGVIDPPSIRTKFTDVHTPPETIEALKTLTSLPLLRPHEFTYGVLATDKIPGLLLYGPPGTGKTLLAKAVAKESGATMLEVSGSDVYDMYVGEGEKNVRAIFTLAKKLSPCVVFIDEADAIFGSRTGMSNRTTHRELINQFLREWDGMNELSAFIMVATNRPFDLDDAVLRRLPRRLLVDLPTEKDRESILKIHLRDEILDPNLSLPDLAKRTPLYSGSDLKNLCVAAALACVRLDLEHSQASSSQAADGFAIQETRSESSPETATTAPDSSIDIKIPPEKPSHTSRILTQNHFDKALEEISASISEDMSSLSAIKKFDEKFGDRRGRRKKAGGWGFSVAQENEQNVETGRVRN